MNEKRKQQCARCGSCTVVCPVFRITGRETLAARGKLHLLSTEMANKPSGHFQDLFAQCLLCGACESVCSRNLPIREEIVQARSDFSHFYGKHSLQKELARIALSRPILLEGLVQAGLSLSRLSLLPEKSGLRIKLGLLENEKPARKEAGSSKRVQLKTESSGGSYFSGCMARYLQPSIGDATTQLAEELTGKSLYEPDKQVCCGLAAWSAGKKDEARKLAKRNIEAFSDLQGQILTSCASCSSHLKKYPALFEGDTLWYEKAMDFSRRVEEFTSFIDANMPERGKVGSCAKIFYHEPCHLRFDKENSGAAHRLLKKIDSIELVRFDADPKCCGQGGLFHLGYPELSNGIFTQICDQVSQAGADVVVTSCSGCLMQWQAGLAMRRSKIQAVHFAQWLKSHMELKS